MADAFALANAFVRIRPYAKGFRAEADAEVRAELAGLEPTIKIGASTEAAKMRAQDLRIYLDKLAARTAELRVKMSGDKVVGAQLTRLYAQMLRLDKKISPEMTLVGFTKAQAELLTMDAALDRAGLIAEGAGKKATLAGKGWDSLWRSLGKAIPLAGGFLGHIAVWHLLLDALVEIIAVWAAAAIAVGAFAAAAVKAARLVITQVHSMNIVMAATNQIIPPMTGNFRKLQEAVKPQVFQLFGAALAVMSHQSGAFATIALGAGHALDVMAARMALVLTSGQGMGRFLRGAVPVLETLGDAWANFGVIVGNVLKALPGFAEILLEIGNEALHLGAQLTTLFEPLIKIVFLLHGTIVWGGLAITIFIGLAKAFKALLAVKIVAFWLDIIGSLAKLVITQGIATASTLALAGAQMALAAVNPVAWAALAVGALVGLAVAFRHVKTDTQKFTASLQEMISKAPVQDALTAVQNAQIANTTRLNAAYSQLNRTFGNYSKMALMNAKSGAINLAYTQQRAAIDELNKSQAALGAEMTRGRGHVAELSRAYGGNAAAQGLLVAAGVTTDQLLTKSNTEWQIAKQMVEDTARAYQFMGATGTVLSNDMEVLNRSASTQVQAVQKLNQAWDAFLGDVTADQMSFDTFQLGMVTLKQNMQKAAAGVNTTTHHLGELKIKADTAGAAMDGLNQSSLALNQAFAQQVMNAGAVIDQLRTAQIGGDRFNQAIKDMVAQMIPFAKGSKQATAQLFALAEEAGIHGPATMSNLVRWLGNTTSASKDLKKIVNEATIKEALLTAAMDDQSKFIKNQLLNSINQAIVKYSGVTDAATAYGKAVAKSGKSSEEAQGKFDVLTRKVFDAQVAMGKGKEAAEKITAKILGIPLKRVIRIVETGVGNFKINQRGIFGPNRSNSGLFNVQGGARGLFIDRGTTPTADDVLVRASKGELIVPTRMVQGGEVDHLRGRIPGFAAGGLAGSTGVMSGQAPVIFDRTFIRNFTTEMKTQMTSAMREAMKAARQAMFAAAVGNVGAGVQRWGPLVRRALIMEGLNPLLAARVMFQMQTESGGNPNIVNNWDSNAAAGTPSMGLMQVIGPTFSAYHWPGTSWNILNPLANIAAALNYARHRYGPTLMSGGMGIGSGHGYAEGTESAAPGWAVVGEKGPELVQMAGGEMVIPASHAFARGGLVEKIHRGERIMRRHPASMRRYSALLDSLGASMEDVRGDRALVRFGHLHGEHLRHARHRLHMDERHHKDLLHEIRPLRHRRHVVSVMEHALQRQEDGIASAIKEAQSRHMTQVVDRLQGRRKHYADLEHWAHWWLNRKWWTPTHHQRVADKQRVHRDIVAVLEKLGLPVIDFDRGGRLMPGLTLAMNRTGRPEPVGPADQKVVLEFRAGPGDAHAQYLLREIQKLVRTKGGGDVQTAFGQAY